MQTTSLDFELLPQRSFFHVRPYVCIGVALIFLLFAFGLIVSALGDTRRVEGISAKISNLKSNALENKGGPSPPDPIFDSKWAEINQFFLWPMDDHLVTLERCVKGSKRLVAAHLESSNKVNAVMTLKSLSYQEELMACLNTAQVDTHWRVLTIGSRNNSLEGDGATIEVGLFN